MPDSGLPASYHLSLVVPNCPNRPGGRWRSRSPCRARVLGSFAPPDGLTAREVEVLALIADGLSNTEIGERLFLGQATVKTHVNRIFAKTGVRDRAQVVRYAYRTGLAHPRG